MPHIRSRLRSLASLLALAASTLAAPANAAACRTEMCVCGEDIRTVDGVVEGRVLTDRPSDYTVEEVQVEVVAVYGDAGEYWTAGDVLTAPKPTEASSGLSLGDAVLVLTVADFPSFLQGLDEGGAPVCYGEPLPLTTAEAVELALRSDCRDTLQTRFPDRQVLPPCPDEPGCTTAGGGAGFLALGLLLAALVFRARRA